MLGDNLIISHQVDYISSQRSFQLKLLKVTKTEQLKEEHFVANEVSSIMLLV